MTKARTDSWLLVLLSLALLALASVPSWANVFASGLTKTGMNSFSYVLNESADVGVTVEVWKVGGGMVYSEALGAQAKGSHNWTWNGTGYTVGDSYKAKIVATDDGYGAWSQISTDGTSTSFYVPTGVSANTFQDSAYFGSIYVSNATTGTTAFGRSNPEGLYWLSADSAAIASGTAGVTWGAGSGPWRSAVGSDGVLYVTDLSNDLAVEVAADLSGSVQLIDASNRTAAQWVAGIQVTGTNAGGDRKIYLVNSNYNDTARKGVIEYNLGAAAAVASGDTGTQIIGPSFFTFYPQDAVRDSAGNWYTGQYRSDPTQASALAKFSAADLPGNTPAWQIPNAAPYSGGYCYDIYDPFGWVAYGNYYDGMVYIFNMGDGSLISSFDAGSRMRDIAFDAAGNLITVDNMTEWMKVWSPGSGANGFTTTSYFTVAVPEPGTFAALLLGVPAVFVFRRKK